MTDTDTAAGPPAADLTDPDGIRAGVRARRASRRDRQRHRAFAVAAVVVAAVVTLIAYVSAPSGKHATVRTGSAVSAGHVPTTVVPTAPTVPTTAAAAAFVPSPGAVEWVATPASPSAASSAPPAPPGTPPCTAFQVQAKGGWQDAKGPMVGGIRFTNISGNPCSIHGEPEVRLSDGRGFRIDLTQRSSSVADPGPALLPPGVADSVSIGLQWANWCGPITQPLSVRVNLPDGGNVAAVQPDPADGFHGVPSCDGSPGGSSMTVDPAQGAAAPQAPPPSAGLTATIRTPSSTATGTTLDYEVTLANPTPNPVPLDPCPSYSESLGPASASFTLNCGPVPQIDPGQSVTFAMRLDVPAGTPPGPATLQWQGGGPAASAPITITTS